MFGNDLIKQIQAEKSKIPLVVEKCIESVESRGKRSTINDSQYINFIYQVWIMRVSIENRVV